MAYSDEVLADSPLAYWRLGDAVKTHGATVVDSSGNGKDGAYYVSSYTVEDVPSLIATDLTNTAMRKSGGGGAAYRTTQDVLPASGDVSIEVWFQIALGTFSSLGITLLGAYDANNVQLYINQSSGDKKIVLATFGNPSGYLEVASSPTNVDDGGIYHVVGTVSGSTGKIYLNGVQIASGTTYSNRWTSEFRVSELSGAGSTITFDEAAVYGTALSPERVLAHYNAGRSLTITAESTEGLGFSSTFSASLTVPRTVTNTVQFASVSSSARRFTPIIIEALAFTPALSASGRFRVTLVDTLAFVSPLDVDADEAWVINLNTRAVCRYIDYGYSSFCRSKDKYYASLGKKLYTLDGAQAVDASAIFGKMEAADGQQARATAVYLGADSDDFMYVKVVTREDTEYVYKARAHKAFLHPVRVDLGKALRARSWELEVYNSNGAAAEIQSLGVLYEPTKRRI